MAGDGDFYRHDRPETPDLAEDRPRGGGPEEPQGRGNWPVWMIVLAILVVFILFVVIFG